jgi:hypothetical protein
MKRNSSSFFSKGIFDAGEAHPTEYVPCTHLQAPAVVERYRYWSSRTEMVS